MTVSESGGGPAIALDPVSLFAMGVIGLLLLCCLGACCYFFLCKRIIAVCSDTTCCDACKPRCERCCASCTWGCWYPTCVGAERGGRVGAAWHRGRARERD